MASRQATASPAAPAAQVGTWDDSAATGWHEFTVDLTKSVTRIGQYEITFAPPAGGGVSRLDFRDPEVQMYCSVVKDGVEAVTPDGTFRITRSQQTLDAFPTIFRVRFKSVAPGRSGAVTIRMLTY